MTDNDDVNDTTAGPCNDETTVVPPAAPGLLAWSDDDDDTEVIEIHSWRRALAIAGLLVVTLGGAAAAVYSDQGGTTVVASYAPTPSVTMASWPTPAPPMRWAPTTTPTPVLPVDKDARFLALIAPLHMAPRYTKGITESAQHLCRSIAEREEGKETRAKWIARILEIGDGNGGDISIDQATGYVDAAIEVYCPQYY